jgi:lon-related putative ATP-dependent protease
MEGTVIQELTVERYTNPYDPALFGYTSSAEVRALQTIIGQERAVRALKFGLGIKEKGFNIFAVGMPGTGRTTAIESFLGELAGKEPVPSDWVYVNDFSDNYRPNALHLPAGKGVEFKTDMDRLIANAVKELREALDSEIANQQRDQIRSDFQQQKQEILERVNDQARQEGFSIQATPVGLLVVPMAKGKPLSEMEFMNLSSQERELLSNKQQGLQAALEAAVRQVKALEKSTQEALEKADQQVALSAIKLLFEELKEKYTSIEEIPEHLDHIQEDILKSLAELRSKEEEPDPRNLSSMALRSQPGRKYIVNVMVNHADSQGAPVVIEHNPTYPNLFGRIEHEAQFGALVTDFTMIRPGALQRANGGYLILPVEQVLRNPYAWESLKRALINNEIRIEDASNQTGMMVAKGLRPEPIPLTVKVILVGRPELYQLLLAFDEHFSELFKVKADFDYSMSRNSDNIRNYAGFVARLCEQENIHHMDASAMARVVEHGSRLAEDQERLTTRFGEIADVIREANYYAIQDNAPSITRAHIQQSIEERFYRSNLVQDRLLQLIQRGTLQISIDGAVIGQVNGLSVLQIGDVSFGQPHRITASVGIGREGLIDIEREANLGGPIHTKGIMILAGFLTGLFARDKPLSLSARLVFEQSYSGVEGDSASSTELYALLSALSELPIRQGVAVTGSVNQKGDIQAIGGVNAKIEGFFKVCRLVGLTGQQGVLIPASNVPHLMLHDEVIQAAREGQFHIWAVETVSQGIEVLTGVPAGERQPDGSFEEGSVYQRADRRLAELAETLARYSRA